MIMIYVAGRSGQYGRTDITPHAITPLIKEVFDLARAAGADLPHANLSKEQKEALDNLRE